MKKGDIIKRVLLLSKKTCPEPLGGIFKDAQIYEIYRDGKVFYRLHRGSADILDLEIDHDTPFITRLNERDIKNMSHSDPTMIGRFRECLIDGQFVELVTPGRYLYCPEVQAAINPRFVYTEYYSWTPGVKRNASTFEVAD